MERLGWALLAVSATSLVSLVGLGVLAWRRGRGERVSSLLTSFAAGSLLGAAFLDLLPHALEARSEASGTPFIQVLAGFVAFFLLERFLYWYHSQAAHEDRPPSVLGPLILLGDGLHNLLDRFVIGAAFMEDVGTGVVAAAAVFVHEIPQELGDFGVLLHTGLSPAKALAYNALSALTSLAGALLSTWVAHAVQGFAATMVALTAGGFLFIGTRLLFELEHEGRFARGFAELGALLAGMGALGALSRLMGD